MFKWCFAQRSSSIEDDFEALTLSAQDNNNFVHSRIIRHVIKLLHNLLVLPVRPTALAPNYENDDEYLMNHKNRGKCVVFNQKKFRYLYERTGTDHDVKRIEHTFGKLGFSVKVCTDYDADAIRDKIKQLSKENHNDNDCLVVIVLSHGKDGSEVYAKNMAYNIKDLWKPFTADKCTTLAGKPKLFFFSTCRGEKRDNGVLLKNIDRTETDGPPSSVYAIPTEADFLFGFSTPPGYVSHRKPTDGTWYIQALCSVLDMHAATIDLLAMLTKTTNKVTKLESKYEDRNIPCGKQVPETHSRLSRLVYFKQKKNVNQ